MSDVSRNSMDTLETLDAPGTPVKNSKLGHDSVMTSSLSNERAQHLYRRLGYVDVGSLLMPDEPLEIVFLKRL